jgi:hypothetical protein
MNERQAPLPICKTCRHYKRRLFREPLCTHTSQTVTDVISGCTEVQSVTCDFQRNGPMPDPSLPMPPYFGEIMNRWREVSCGPDGKFWEVK